MICTDVRTIGFEKAWREVNQGVKNYVVPEECRSCDYSTICFYCPNQHKDVAAKHLCNGASCDWRKLLADIAEE